jgi:hypothetical protein
VVVHKPRPYTILVADANGELPEDRNWKGDDQAKTGGAVLYSRDEGLSNERAYAFGTEEDRFHFDIEIRDIGSEFVGKKVQCTMQNEDTYASRYDRRGTFAWSESLEVAGNTATFRFSFGGTAPFGFFGIYALWLHLCDAPKDAANPPEWTKTDGNIPLEAYYLSVPELPKFYGDEIPLLLLRMFLLPQNVRTDNSSTKDWISNVTNIVFGSNKPFDGRPSETTDHWLTYDIAGGSASFASSYGGQGLNLDAWLDAFRNYQTHEVITRINCYDQAAITEVTLCLGVHHEQIHWEYHQKYGFIDAPLVGWGKVNSPYFDGEETKPRYESEDPDRQPFRNHAYLSWSEQRVTKAQYDESKTLINEGTTRRAEYVENARKFEDSHNLKLYMIDSCGGPHVGTELREDYESKLKLIPDDPSTCFSTSVSSDYESRPWRWVEEHHIGPGVTNWYSYLPPSMIGTFDKKVDEFKSLTGMASADVYHVNDPQNLLAVFQKYVTDQMAPRWQKSKSYTIRPYTADDKETKVYETKTNFTTRKDGRLDQAASMRIAFNPTSLGAQAAAAAHLAFKECSIQNAGTTIEKRGDSITLDGVQVPVVGSRHIRAFVWYNVAVEVTIDENKEWNSNGNKVMQEMLKGLKELTIEGAP